MSNHSTQANVQIKQKIFDWIKFLLFWPCTILLHTPTTTTSFLITSSLKDDLILWEPCKIISSTFFIVALFTKNPAYNVNLSSYAAHTKTNDSYEEKILFLWSLDYEWVILIFWKPFFVSWFITHPPHQIVWYHLYHSIYKLHE